MRLESAKTGRERSGASPHLTKHVFPGSQVQLVSLIGSTTLCSSYYSLIRLDTVMGVLLLKEPFLLQLGAPCSYGSNQRDNLYYSRFVVASSPAS